MPIWDRLTQDPMSAMILMSSLQQLPQSMSKQNLPPRGAYAPQGYGQQQDGGMGDMVPQMLRMQQMQAQQANLQADNALQQRKFEYEQKQSIDAQAAARGIEERFGLPAGSFAHYAEQLGPGIADRLKRQEINGRLVDGDNGRVIAAFPTYTDTPTGPMDTLSGNVLRDQVRMKHDLRKSAAGATNVSVSPTAIYGAQQGAFDKKIYDAAGDSYVALQKDAEAARKMADDFKQINAVLGETPTGEGFDEWRLRFSKLARGIGIPVDEKAISSKETALSLVNQFALGARSPDGPLGGLPGSASNQDINFLKAIPPGIETTPEGRMLMADVQEAKAEHKSRKAQAARQYVQGRGGQVDPIELDSFKAAYDKEHPMFGDVEKKWSGKFGGQSAGGAQDDPLGLLQ